MGRLEVAVAKVTTKNIFLRIDGKNTLFGIEEFFS